MVHNCHRHYRPFICFRRDNRPETYACREAGAILTYTARLVIHLKASKSLYNKKDH